MPKRTRLSILALGFLVVSLFAVSITVSEPLRQQLIASYAKERVRVETAADRFQNYVDSTIRRRERAGQSGAGPVCQGAWCLGPELIANQNDPANQTGLPKEIIDTYNAAVNNNDQTALDKLKTNSETLYNQAQAAIAQKQISQQQEQVQQLTNECNADNTRGQYICTTPSGLQEYANFRIAEARQLLARIEIAAPGTYTNAQIDQYLATLAHYVDLKVITSEDYIQAENFVTVSRAAASQTTTQTTTNTIPETTTNAVGGTTGTTVGVTGTATLPTKTQTTTNTVPQTTTNAVGGTTGTTVGVTGTATFPTTTQQQTTPLKVVATSGGGKTLGGQINNFFTNAYNFVTNIPKNIPIPVGIGPIKLPSISISVPSFIKTIFPNFPTTVQVNQPGGVPTANRPSQSAPSALTDNSKQYALTVTDASGQNILALPDTATVKSGNLVVTTQSGQKITLSISSSDNPISAKDIKTFADTIQKLGALGRYFPNSITLVMQPGKNMSQPYLIDAPCTVNGGPCDLKLTISSSQTSAQDIATALGATLKYGSNFHDKKYWYNDLQWAYYYTFYAGKGGTPGNYTLYDPSQFPDQTESVGNSMPRAESDLANAIARYLTDPDAFKAQDPARYAFIDAVYKGYNPMDINLVVNGKIVDTSIIDTTAIVQNNQSALKAQTDYLNGITWDEALKNLPDANQIARFKNQIITASQESGVPVSIIVGIIQRESSGNPNEKTGDAVGLMQVKGGSRDVVTNLKQGTKLLKDIYANPTLGNGNWRDTVALYYGGDWNTVLTGLYNGKPLSVKPFDYADGLLSQAGIDPNALKTNTGTTPQSGKTIKAVGTVGTGTTPPTQNILVRTFNNVTTSATKFVQDVGNAFVTISSINPVQTVVNNVRTLFGVPQTPTQSGIGLTPGMQALHQGTTGITRPGAGQVTPAGAEATVPYQGYVAPKEAPPQFQTVSELTDLFNQVFAERGMPQTQADKKAFINDILSKLRSSNNQSYINLANNPAFLNYITQRVEQNTLFAYKPYDKTQLVQCNLWAIGVAVMFPDLHIIADQYNFSNGNTFNLAKNNAFNRSQCFGDSMKDALSDSRCSNKNLSFDIQGDVIAVRVTDFSLIKNHTSFVYDQHFGVILDKYYVDGKYWFLVTEANSPKGALDGTPQTYLVSQDDFATRINPLDKTYFLNFTKDNILTAPTVPDQGILDAINNYKGSAGTTPAAEQPGTPAQANGSSPSSGPVYSQVDPQWQDKIPVRGVGKVSDTTCAIFVLANLTHTDPLTVWDNIKKTTPYVSVPQKGFPSSFVLNQLTTVYHDKPVLISGDNIVGQIKNYTDAGIPVYLTAEKMKIPGVGTPGHHTMVTGVDDQGMLILNDSAYSSPQGVHIPLSYFDDANWAAYAIYPGSTQP